MPDRDFERYFHDRAAVADELAERRLDVESMVLSTSALDALGAIWLHDFPADWPEAGRPRSSLRMTRLVKKFAPADEDGSKIAVVSFAEDWRRYKADAAAERLLSARIGTVRGELPHAYQDVPLAQLIAECPQIGANPRLVALAEDYEYPAMAYRFYRCPLVHSSKPSDRAHGFARNDEVMYMSLRPRVSSIGFGPKVFTRWLRRVASGYVAHCENAGVRPADELESGGEGEEHLAAYWARI